MDSYSLCCCCIIFQISLLIILGNLLRCSFSLNNSSRAIALVRLCRLLYSQLDASLSGIGLYRLAAEDSDDNLLASVSVAASLSILLPYLSSASVSARMLNC